MTTRRMTVTERALLARAAASRHRVGCVLIGFRTGRRNSSYGSREAHALGRLVRAGLVVIVSQQSHVDCRSRYSDHYTETVYRLVETPSAPTGEPQ